MLNKFLCPQADKYPESSDGMPDDIKETLKDIKATERARIQKDIHLKASQRITLTGSWETDIINDDNFDLNPLYWSEETYRIFGYDCETTIASNNLFFRTVHPDDRALVMETVKKALETKSVYDIEHRLILADKTEKIVRERGEIISDKGKPVIMIGTVQDITNWKKAEKDLQKTNDQLNTLFENMQEAYFSIDMPTATLLQMSQACEKVYGYTVEEFEKNSNLWYELILDEDKNIITKNEKDLLEGRSIVNIYRIRHKSGEIRWMESKITPTFDSDGKLIRIDGLTSDITSRKEAEATLKNSEYKMRSLLENTADAIMVTDEKTKISYASHSMYRIMGYKPTEVIGMKASDFIYHEDEQLLEEHVKKALDNPGKAIPISYRRVKKDGTVIWCEGTATNLLHDEAVQGIIVNFRDITGQKNYEHALETSNEDLKKSNRELDKFVYSVSHDLRAPLSSILGILGLMETETVDSIILNDIRLIKGSINKLDGFIADILDYSRNCRLALNYTVIQFNKKVHGIIDHLKYMSDAIPGILIKVNIEESIPFYSDKSRVSIILNNLISNALRYSDPGKPDPFVQVSIVTEEKQAIISVKDNGVGINKENHDKIFEMFYRMSKKSGSGLGLYILKEAVEKLNGSIQLESEPGLGTEFVVYLPNHTKG